MNITDQKIYGKRRNTKRIVPKYKSPYNIVFQKHCISAPQQLYIYLFHYEVNSEGLNVLKYIHVL